MRPGNVLRRLGVAAVVLGLGAGTIAVDGGCANSPGRGTELGASEQKPAAAPAQLPSMDLDAPRDFQTASFALG